MRSASDRIRHRSVWASIDARAGLGTQATGAAHWLGRRMAWSVVAAALVTAGVGCASGGKHGARDSDEVSHDVAIEVNNNLTVPTVITVYLIAQQGARKPLGDVPGAQTRTFTFRPFRYSDSYRLLAVRQLANSIRSQSFNVGGPEIGTISWALIPNIVSFYNLPEEPPAQDTGAAAKPPAPK